MVPVADDSSKYPVGWPQHWNGTIAWQQALTFADAMKNATRNHLLIWHNFIYNHIYTHIQLYIEVYVHVSVMFNNLPTPIRRRSPQHPFIVTLQCLAGAISCPISRWIPWLGTTCWTTTSRTIETGDDWTSFGMSPPCTAPWRRSIPLEINPLSCQSLLAPHCELIKQRVGKENVPWLRNGMCMPLFSGEKIGCFSHSQLSGAFSRCFWIWIKS